MPSPLHKALPFAVLLLAGSLAHPQQSPLSPHDWAVKAAAAEAADLGPYHEYLRYRTQSLDRHGNLVRDLIESTDGPVARLISKENRPLTAEEDANERTRLQAMLDDPAAYAKHVRNEASSRKQVVDIIRLMPDAMLFTATPGQPQQPGRTGEIVLDFHPNPAWSPPTLASEALTGIQGRLWLDPATAHPTRLEANTFRPVNVGFGIFAKLFPGGTIALDQVEPIPHRWLYSHFIEHLTLRALMVKTYKEEADLQASNFTRVDPMTYQQAIRLLLATPLPR